MGPGPLVTPGSAASALVLPGSRDTSKPAAVEAFQCATHISQSPS